MRALRPLIASIIIIIGAALAPSIAQDSSEKTEPTRDAKHGRVLLISFDAFRPEVVREERFAMPNLRALAARGVVARKVVGVFPTLTYPSHTAIATGCRPARHGVFHNTVWNGDGGSHRWYWEAAHIRAGTIWDAARKGGLKTALVRWPVSVGAHVDWNIPEVFGEDYAADHWALVKQHATPGLMEEVCPEPPANALDEAEVDAKMAEAAALIIEKKKPELMMIHLVQADGAQHRAGRDDPIVAQAFAKLDEHLGRLQKALETAGVAAETNVIVTGDHGFMDVHTVIRPNALLRELGLLRADGPKIAKWDALAHGGGGCAAIYLHDPADKVTEERVVATLRAAAAGPYRGIMNVLDRAALEREEAFPGAACALEAEPGYCFDHSLEAAGDVLGQAGVRGMHGHLPTREELATCLVAAGPGLASGRVIPAFRQIDVAPLAARLLGVDMGPGVEGKLVPGVLAPVKRKGEGH